MKACPLSTDLDPTGHAGARNSRSAADLITSLQIEVC